MDIAATLTAYSAQSERRFQAIVNGLRVSAAEAADIGLSVHDGTGDGRISAMTCSNSRTPTAVVTCAAWSAVPDRAEPVQWARKLGCLALSRPRQGKCQHY
jgi:hypothetical protein